MKLFTIKFRHIGPKDSKDGIEGYVLADTEQAVMEGIDKLYNYGNWGNYLEHFQDDTPEDEESVNRAKKYHEAILVYRGEIDHPDNDYGDGYYGITYYGWDEGKEISLYDAQVLVRLGIAQSWLTDTVLYPPHWTDIYNVYQES